MNQQLGSSTQNSSVIPDSDEISLTDLFRNLWRQRGLVFAFIILAVAAVITLQFFKGSLSAITKVEYPITLNFDGEVGYPNGSAFSPNDLISTSVLERVIPSLELDVSASRLGAALSAGYSNSLLSSAELSLGNILQDNKVPADVKISAEDALAELKTESQRFLTLHLSLERSGISAVQAEDVVSRIVDVWAKASVEQGLLSLDISRPINPFVVAQSGNLIDTYDSAANYLKSLSGAVEGLTKEPGAQSLVVAGKSLSDLQREISALEGTDVGPLREFAYSNSSSLASVDPAIQVRLFARQRLLKLEQERLTKLIASYDSALSQLASIKGSDGGAGRVNSGQGNLQLEQSVFDSLLQMGTKLGAVENRNKLFDRRTKAVEDLLALEKEMAILMGVAGSAYGDLNPTEILKSALPSIEQRLNSIQQDVDAFFNAYRDISLQSGAQLYSAQAAPQVRGGFVVSVKKMMKYAVLAAVLGLMLGIMVALIRAAMINSNKN
ncbi:hypothetical protein [Bacterioplanoides sp.]|uniref:hypothetical protein n=1 Tax=Bacterioplanoides sp. TaxID=2066072 RepID=UPI003B5CBA21